MKNPVVRCVTCGEAVFTNRKPPITCQQCWIAKNAHRKYQRLTSKCNWRSGSPILPALDRPKKKKKPKPPTVEAGKEK
jgi:hypothetical protein